MSEEKMKARSNDVAHCGSYCRTCYWYNSELRQTAQHLLKLVKDNLEVADWINYKGGDSKTTIKGLEILSKSACNFTCKGGSGWGRCPVRRCCISKDLEFCFECSDFPCSNWDEKGEHPNVFTDEKKNRLLGTKKTGVEEWIKK
jgi:hypothetical protein